MSDAALAEMEAGVYGLQVQNNYLDQFIHDVENSLSLMCCITTFR